MSKTGAGLEAWANIGYMAVGSMIAIAGAVGDNAIAGWFGLGVASVAWFGVFASIPATAIQMLRLMEPLRRTLSMLPGLSSAPDRASDLPTSRWTETAMAAYMSGFIFVLTAAVAIGFGNGLVSCVAIAAALVAWIVFRLTWPRAYEADILGRRR